MHLKQSQICKGLKAWRLTSGFLGVHVNEETRITMKRAPKHVPTKDAENTATNPAISCKNAQLLETIKLGVIQKFKNVSNR